VLAGEQIFKTVGCANCHVTDVVTGANHPFAELRTRISSPIAICCYTTWARISRTTAASPLPTTRPRRPRLPSGVAPPLWGTGLLTTVNKHSNLLHDGRAATVLEAVLWHGGEAEATKQRVMKLPAADRHSPDRVHQFAVSAAHAAFRPSPPAQDLTVAACLLILRASHVVPRLSPFSLVAPLFAADANWP